MTRPDRRRNGTLDKLFALLLRDGQFICSETNLYGMASMNAIRVGIYRKRADYENNLAMFDSLEGNEIPVIRTEKYPDGSVRYYIDNHKAAKLNFSLADDVTISDDGKFLTDAPPSGSMQHDSPVEISDTNLDWLFKP